MATAKEMSAALDPRRNSLPIGPIATMLGFSDRPTYERNPMGKLRRQYRCRPFTNNACQIGLHARVLKHNKPLTIRGQGARNKKLLGSDFTNENSMPLSCTEVYPL